jgi:phenylalanyl-tRNA synthetase beta chain
MIIDRDVTFSRIRDIARKAGKEIVRSVTLFDVYESKKLERGKKSYAVGIILQDTNKTLTDKEIEKIMNRIQGNLEKQVNAQIRQAT